MVNVEVVNTVTQKRKTLASSSVSVLLDHVCKSRHFGPGTLEDSNDDIVSDEYVISDGAKLFWVPENTGGSRPSAVLEEYNCPEPGSGFDFDSWSFDAELQQPVLLLPEDAERCHLNSVPQGMHDVVQIASGGTYHNLSQYVMILLQNDKSGTAEDAMHTRDDALMKVISVVGCTSRERNRQSSGSTAGSRIDIWLGQPPFVLVEEKANPSELNVAIEEVHSKFVFIPHYERIPYVIAIGIAGDHIKMEAFGRQGVLKSTRTLYLSTQGGCIQALRAAINVGLLCRHILRGDLVPSVKLPFNQVHKNDRRSLLITHLFVEKTYFGSSMSPDAQKQLMEFYKATANVQYVEHATRTEERSGNLVLRLSPVGLERKPSGVQEVKVALRCILEAADDCHRLGWVLNDLRWANMIRLASGLWTIIDCEYARRIDSPLPAELVVKRDWSTTCSAVTDLYCIGKMLQDVEQHLDRELGLLLQVLTSKRKQYGTTAGQVLQKFAWLRQASPSQGAKKQRKRNQAQQPDTGGAEAGPTSRGAKNKKRKQQQKQSKGVEAGPDPRAKKQRKRKEAQQPDTGGAEAGPTRQGGKQSKGQGIRWMQSAAQDIVSKPVSGRLWL